MPEAYIFDFDGVLVDTMVAHGACYEEALAEVGVPMPLAEYYSMAGMTGREQIRHFAAKVGKTVDVDAVYRRKGELYLKHIDKATPIPVNIALLRVLKAAGHPIAIASGGSRQSIAPVMERFDIPTDALVTCDEVERGKPAPDLFLIAARRLGADPADCTVVEDSDVGVEAALRGGMKALRFHRLNDPKKSSIPVSTPAEAA